MLEKILVPLDGSDLANRALPYATALARTSGATLILLQAVDAIALGRQKLDEPDPLAQLQAVASTLREGGVQAEPYLCHLYMEEVGAGIVRSARERRADLIVMSTHGRGGLGRWIYGSVADAVLREAEVPVLLIPAACQHRWPTDRKPRILVPLDGSNLATQALGPALDLADLLGAELLLLQAIPPVPYVEGYYYVVTDQEPELAEVQAALEATAEGLSTERRKVTARAVLGYPITEVQRIAREEGVDLIAMATHGRGGLARVVMGSVATGTLQRAELPILLVRPTGLQEAAPEPAALEDATTSLAESEPLEPVVNLSLTARELDLLERGLGDLLYLPESDAQLAKPARELLARLRRAEQELAEPVGPAGDGATR